MNEVRISGRLSREPEVKQLENATLAVAPLVINDGYKTPTGEHREATTFVDVQLWGEDATRVAALKKGQEVQFIGSLRQRQWEDRETGVKRTKLYVKAWQWEAIERKAAEQAQAAPGWNDEPGFSRRLLTSMSARKWILLVYFGVLITAIAAVQFEIQNLEKKLARERSDSNRAMAAAVAQFEHDLFTKMDAPGPRRSVDDGLGKLPDGDFRAPVKWPAPTPATK